MSVENYVRRGYTVKGSTPVVVEEYGRPGRVNVPPAVRAAAEEAQRHLQELGLEGEVEIWEQRWKSVTTYESEGRVALDTLRVERRREERRLDEERAEMTAVEK